MIHADGTKTSGIRFTHDPASACGAEGLRAPLFSGSPLGVSGGEMFVSMERDRLGSFRTARMGGDAVSEREYTPYGGDYTDTGAFLLYGFTGHLLGTGNDPLYYAPYRNYSPTHARWLTRDPLGMIDGTNVYGYVREDPVRSYDPSGLWTVGDCDRWGDSLSFILAFILPQDWDAHILINVFKWGCYLFAYRDSPPNDPHPPYFYSWPSIWSIFLDFPLVIIDGDILLQLVPHGPRTC